MKALAVVLGLAVLSGIGWWLYFQVTAHGGDVPEVALAKRNLPAYARQQHERVQQLEALLREVRAEDAIIPALSTELRRRVERALDG